MGKRILAIAAVLIVAGFAYISYTSYDATRSGVDGEVYSNDPPSGKGKHSPVTDSRDTRSAESGPAIVYPTPTLTAPAYPATTAQSLQQSMTGVSAPPLSGDTIDPNPPNGMVFAGKGQFQLYRQGNITWRLNTDNGQSCIIFATEEEWKKEKVLRAGCGKT
jgi:hypothetical protein